MKKVININFQGRVVPIEETAYDILKQYVESLRRFFANEEGRDEIINDIEDRIAELFTETLKKGSTCITDEDVDTIIASIGRPEDFEAQENNVKAQLSGEEPGQQSNSQQQQQSTESDAPRGRLYRDEADKLLGGVCGGIANYLRIDASLVRILFAIITFGGFGSGLLIYILMWIILPKKSLERNVIRKRLFRNPDEKVVGGVASGLAAYFDIAVWIPRLIFAFPLVAGIFSSIVRSAFWHFDPFPSVVFGSFGGTLFVVYVILWAVIPEARTASEKLEMKGEKVDLNTIKNTIQEDLKGFGARAEKWGKDIGEKANQWGKEVSENVSQKSSRVSADISAAGKRSSRTIFSVIGVIIKAIFLFAAGVIAFALLMALIFGSIKGFDFMPLKDYLLEGDAQYSLVWPTILLFLILPVAGLFIWIIRRLIKARAGSAYLGWIFGGLWTLGWVCAIWLGSSIAQSFQRKVSEKSSIALTQPSANNLIVTLGDTKGRYYPYHVFDDDNEDNDDIFMMTKDEDSMLLNSVSVLVAKSDDSAYHAYLIRSSRGSNLTEAEEKMQQIELEVTQKDSILTIQKGFSITKATKFRDQRVAIIIEVPVGKKVKFDESIAWFDRFDLDYGNGRGRYSQSNTYDKSTYQLWNLNKDYRMTGSGPEVIRKNKNNDSDEGTNEETTPQKSKEELKKEIEDQQKELDQKKKELQQADTTYKYKPSAATGQNAPVKPVKDTKPAGHMMIGDIMMMRFGS